MQGWIKLHRKIVDSPYWLDEPFTRGQAWVDMLMLANHEQGHIRKQGLRIDLFRGDVGMSEVELAARWKWSRGKVRRFFDELEKDSMIERKNVHETDRRKFVISISNYDKYQDNKKADSTGDGQAKEQAAVQATVQEQEVKNKKEDIGESSGEENKPKRKVFVPPSVEEVTEYCQQRNNGINPIKFHAFYDAKGWMIGKNKMKDWKKAVITWEQTDRNNGDPLQGKEKCKTCTYDADGCCSGRTDEQRKECTAWVRAAA